SPHPLCFPSRISSFHHSIILGPTLLHQQSFTDTDNSPITASSLASVSPAVSGSAYASPPRPQAPPGQHLGDALHGRCGRWRPHAALPCHARRRRAPGQADDQVGAALGAQHLLLYTSRRAHSAAHGASDRPRRPARREPPTTREDGQACRREHQERHRAVRAQAVVAVIM
ncbi:hypothetical protein TOPH_01895, partial [Tolypocladium ophioglossoides CBS 100239]